MRKLFEAAFNPPPKASDAEDRSKCAVLPENTQHELTLSEVHSKLDWALNFLIREVGYALLDDIRPHIGGGVQLREPPASNLAVPKGERSAKLPAKLGVDGDDVEEYSTRTGTPMQGFSESSPADFLDDTILKLLDEAASARMKDEEDEVDEDEGETSDCYEECREEKEEDFSAEEEEEEEEDFSADE